MKKVISQLYLENDFYFFLGDSINIGVPLLNFVNPLTPYINAYISE
nr:Putative uncharacterized protein [Moritella viscosa]SHO14353.1 Putative uncharacterized protein [Moritella viscosa]SHO18894.1 Putative uncharacterized protein [Moritella viscosa]